MLHEFLTRNKIELVGLHNAKLALHRTNMASGLEHGIPQLLDQIIETLEIERVPNPLRSREISGPSDGSPGPSEIGTTAACHGRELQEQGYTVDQVVHNYGALCQAITELATSRGEFIRTDEFKTLNRCLDNAIADAVREFGMQREKVFEVGGVRSSIERMGYLAHELRNRIHTATMAVSAMKSGYVGLAGATGGVLDRSLSGMAALVNRALADVRGGAGLPVRKELVSLAGFIAEAGYAAELEGHIRDCVFTVAEVDSSLGIEVDRDLLSAALGNLLHNAFKFTHPRAKVSLTAYAAGDRVLIDVQDHCGGLPPGNPENFFDPFVQRGADKSGLGLGLTISRRSVEANHGTLSVKDLPGSGCVFTINLPMHALPESPAQGLPTLH